MRSLELNRAVVEGQSCGRFFCIDQFNDEGIVRSFDSNLVTLHKNLQLFRAQGASGPVVICFHFSNFA